MTLSFYKRILRLRETRFSGDPHISGGGLGTEARSRPTELANAGMNFEKLVLRGSLAAYSCLPAPSPQLLRQHWG